MLTYISASSKLKFCRARQSEYSVSCSYSSLLNSSIRSSISQINISIFSRHPNISLANEDIGVVDQVHKGGVDILLQPSNCIHHALSSFRIHSSTRANSKNFPGLELLFAKLPTRFISNIVPGVLPFRLWRHEDRAGLPICRFAVDKRPETPAFVPSSTRRRSPPCCHTFETSELLR